MRLDAFGGSLEVCERHAERLRWAMGTLAARFPLSPTELSELSDMDLAEVVLLAALEHVKGFSEPYRRG